MVSHRQKNTCENVKQTDNCGLRFGSSWSELIFGGMRMANIMVRKANALLERGIFVQAEGIQPCRRVSVEFGNP